MDQSAEQSPKPQKENRIIKKLLPWALVGGLGTVAYATGAVDFAGKLFTSDLKDISGQTPGQVTPSSTSEVKAPFTPVDIATETPKPEVHFNWPTQPPTETPTQTPTSTPTETPIPTETPEWSRTPSEEEDVIIREDLITVNNIYKELLNPKTMALNPEFGLVEQAVNDPTTRLEQFTPLDEKQSSQHHGFDGPDSYFISTLPKDRFTSPTHEEIGYAFGGAVFANIGVGVSKENGVIYRTMINLSIDKEGKLKSYAKDLNLSKEEAIELLKNTFNLPQGIQWTDYNSTYGTGVLGEVTHNGKRYQVFQSMTSYSYAEMQVTDTALETKANPPADRPEYNEFP